MLDATTFALLVVALTWASGFSRALRVALRLRWLLAFGVLTISTFDLALARADPGGPDAAASGLHGALLTARLFLLAYLIYAWTFLEFVKRQSSRCRIWRDSTWWLVAVVWTFEGALQIDARWLPPAGAVQFWLLDYFNKVLVGLVLPLARPLGLEPGSAFIVPYFRATLVFVSDHLVALAFAGNLAIAAALYELVRRRTPELAARSHDQFGPAPRGLALVAVVAWIGLRLAAPAPGRPTSATSGDLEWGARGARLVLELALGRYGLAGAWLTFRLTRTSARAGPLLGALAIVAVLHPIGLAAIACLGFVDSLGVFRRLRDGGAPASRRAFDALQSVLTGAALAVRPARALGIVLLLYLPQNCMRAHLGIGAPQVPAPGSRPVPIIGESSPTAADLVRVAAPSGALWIDRFEFPNRNGSRPLTGASPREAEAMCGARGEHLCTRDEWAWACGGGAGRPYIVGDLVHSDVADALGRICNVGREDGVRPSATDSECVNDLGIADLVGNAYEWVSLPAKPGFFALAGSFFGYDDPQYTTCDYAVLVHEDQISIVEGTAIGFRCCG